MDNIKVPNTKIIETIDQGFGHFLCKGTSKDDQEVMVEVYLKKEGASHSDVSDFLDRVQLYKKINHPNISKLMDGGELSEGGAFLSIEMEDEIRLVDRLRNNEWLSPREATALIIDLARALQAIHETGLIHGELRPSNILFDPETGHVKLRNIIRYRDDKRYVLKMVSRRPEFAAPEQIRFTEIDHRTDMYPLGLIFYKMLTGKSAVESESVEDVWRYHLEGSIPLLPDELLGIEGLQEVLTKLLQRRKKMRYETDEELILALEEVYDHLFVEEESSMGRIVTLETSSKQREEKKKKGKPHFDPKKSKKMGKVEKAEKVEVAGPGWKKGQREKLKTNKNSRRLKQIKEKVAQENKNNEEKTPIPQGPLYFAGVALVVLLIITKVFFTGSDEIEESDFVKEAPALSSYEKPKEVEKVVPEKAAPVEKSSEPMTKKATVTKAKKAATKLPEKFASKIDEVKAYGKLPQKEAIEKLKLFLDDEDMGVRMLAVQLYQGLKHDDFEEAESTEGMTGLEMMKLKLSAANDSVPLKLINELSKDPSDDATQALILALDHKLDPVREKALELLKSRKTVQTFKAISEKMLTEAGNELYIDMFIDYRRDYIPTLEKIIDEKDEQSALVFMKPLSIIGGDDYIPQLVEWVEKRPSIGLHIAMELVQLGEKGIDAVIELFVNETKHAKSLTYLSALREAELNEKHLSHLFDLTTGDLNEARKTKLLRLLALRQPELNILANQKTGSEQQAVTLMLISEMKNPPDDSELRRLVDFLGTSGDAIDQRIISTLSNEGARSHKYLIHAIRKRLDSDVKLQLVEIMASYGDGETLEQLLGLIGSSSTLTNDVKEIIYQKLFLSGDKLIPIVLSSKASLKEKVNLLVDLNSVASKNALIKYLESLKSLEFKKAFVFLLDREELSIPIVESMLSHPFDDDVQLLILKGLEKEDLELDMSLFINLMNHENSKVRDVVLDIYESNIDPTEDKWAVLYDQVKYDDAKLFMIKNIDKDSPVYSEIIYSGIADVSDDVRIAAYQKVSSNPMLAEDYNYLFTNKLYEEESKKALPILMTHLLKRPGGPSLPYCIWSNDNGSRTVKKVTDAILSKVASNLEKVELLQSYLLEDYVFELRVGMLKFLNQIKVDYLPFLLENTNLNDKDSVKLLREGVMTQSKKSAPVLLSSLSKTKNSQLKEEIEELLKLMKVEYQLDPASGKYILK